MKYLLPTVAVFLMAPLASAAVQAKAMGKSVVVVGPDTHLGGLSAGVS
ncbi:MAG: hypothetical protein U0746_16610 [Gemmataceae bacterium]